MGWWGVLYGVGVLGVDVVGGMACNANPPVRDWMVLADPRARFYHVGPRPATRTRDGPEVSPVGSGAGRAGVAGGAGVRFNVTGK